MLRVEVNSQHEADRRRGLAGLIALSQDTRSDVQALTTPLRHVDTGVSTLLQQNECIATRLSEMQLQTRQSHETTLDLRQSMSEHSRLLSQQIAKPAPSLGQYLLTALGKSGTDYELLREQIEFSGQKREEEATAMAEKIEILVGIAVR